MVRCASDIEKFGDFGECEICGEKLSFYGAYIETADEFSKNAETEMHCVCDYCRNNIYSYANEILHSDSLINYITGIAYKHMEKEAIEWKMRNSRNCTQ